MATTPKEFYRLPNPIAPRLPSATAQYEQHFQDQYTNILRLYFNQLDSVNSTLLGDLGGRFINNPYAAVQRTTDFTWAASSTAALVTCNQNDYMSGTSNDGTDGIHVDYAGIYNLQFSIQFGNSDTQIHNSVVWFRINGTDAAGTASKFDVPGSHGGTDGFLIGACNFFLSLQAGDYVEMWAASDQAKVGGTAGVYMDSAIAQTLPYAAPAIPSVVMTLSFVSTLPT